MIPHLVHPKVLEMNVFPKMIDSLKDPNFSLAIDSISSEHEEKELVPSKHKKRKVQNPQSENKKTTRK